MSPVSSGLIPRLRQNTKKAASPGCVLSTIYHVLGIDYRHAFYDHARRPLQILAEGRPIEDLI